ncbi:MAG: carbohydrate ABC transporter permease [Acidobacteria bacterium]|nr:carbohydrate ABC transporter permease [Acidobacteriota bacterium]
MLNLKRYLLRTRIRQESIAGTAMANLLLIFFAVVSIIPMLWLLLAPSKTDAEITDRNPLAFGSIEGYRVAWENLQSFNDGVVKSWAWNSLWYTAAIVVIATTSATLAGFVLAASKIRIKKFLLISTLITMLIPPMALVVPIFVLIDKIKLMDNPLGVILVSSLYPFGTFLAYIYFSTTIPTELYEAARIDGCNDYRLFSKIALPLSGPVVSLLMFFAFVGNWANFFLPYVLLPSPENYTLPIGLGFLFYSTPAINPGVGATSLPIFKPEIALAGILIALPIMLVFMMAQKRLIRGMLSGSIKE